MPWPMASGYEAIRTGAPFTSTSPAVRSCRPQIVLAISLRPAPMRPNRPRISPRCRRKLTSLKSPRLARSLISSITSPVSGSVESLGGYSSLSARPTILSTTAEVVVSAVRTVSISLPSRRIVMVSQFSNTSRMRWLMYRTPMPGFHQVGARW